MALCVSLAAASLYVLAFGTAVFCCAPSPRGIGFWHGEKFSYGLLPVALAIAVLVVTLRLWVGAFERKLYAWLVGCLAVPLIVTADVVAYQGWRASADDAIKLDWKPESGVFSWGSGSVTIPSGFTYHRQNGIDSVVGYFKSDDGSRIIRHDIGELAGEHGGTGDFESAVEGSRLRLGRARYIDDKGAMRYLSAVSFIDAGCANFSISAANEQDVAAIELVAKSFRPAASAPAWLRPLLPEVLRSDCRYRFQVPEELQTLIIKFLDRVFPP